jgi:hypothetical protein
MIWFEDIGERTSTLPFFINSQIDMAGFVNLHNMAPVKPPIFCVYAHSLCVVGVF